MWTLNEADLDKVTGGNNANKSPGVGNYTAMNTYNYNGNNGYPGSPDPSKSSHPIGTNNGFLQSGNHVGQGQETV